MKIFISKYNLNNINEDMEKKDYKNLLPNLTLGLEFELKLKDTFKSPKSDKSLTETLCEKFGKPSKDNENNLLYIIFGSIKYNKKEDVKKVLIEFGFDFDKFENLLNLLGNYKFFDNKQVKINNEFKYDKYNLMPDLSTLEIITPILKYEEALVQIPKLANAFYDLYISCISIHIHLSNNGIVETELKSLIDKYKLSDLAYKIYYISNEWKSLYTKSSPNRINAEHVEHMGKLNQIDSKLNNKIYDLIKTKQINNNLLEIKDTILYKNIFNSIIRVLHHHNIHPDTSSNTVEVKSLGGNIGLINCMDSDNFKKVITLAIRNSEPFLFKYKVDELTKQDIISRVSKVVNKGWNFQVKPTPIDEQSLTELEDSLDIICDNQNKVFKFMKTDVFHKLNFPQSFYYKNHVISLSKNKKFYNVDYLKSGNEVSNIIWYMDSDNNIKLFNKKDIIIRIIPENFNDILYKN